MSKQTINIGASPNDGTGTPLRTSFDYTNQNFTEIYTALGGGVALPGATTQVIFNDGGTNLAGDAGLVYNKTTDALTVAGLVTAGSATITGDLTVDTSTLKVDSTNNRVGIGTTTPALPLDVVGGIQVTSGSAGGLYQWAYGASASSRSWRAWNDVSANGDFQISTSTTRTGSTYSDRYRIDVTGVHEWSNTSGTAMTLNSTGLLVGTTSDLTGANISSSKGLGTANIATNRFATVEYGSGASGAFTTITISVTVSNSSSSVIIEALLTGFSGVYLDHVAGRYSNQAAVVIRNNASVGTTAASLAVDATVTIYTLTITTVVTNPVIKVKATVGGLGGSITLPVITFA
jgi:hypothetical protein